MTRLTAALAPVILWPVSDELRLLRLYVLLRLATLVPTWVVLRWGFTVQAGAVWLPAVILIPCLFVWIPGLGRRLPAGWHLAASLFLLISSQAVELAVTSSTRFWQPFLSQAGQDLWPFITTWRSESFFYLLVPVVLAAWSFGYRGMAWAATWAAGTYLCGWLALWWSEGHLPLGSLITLPPKLIILYLISFLVAYLSTVQRRQHAELAAAHAQLRREAALAEQLVTSRERNRLARELHDTLAHALSGLSVQLQALGALFDDDPIAARGLLQAAQHTARSGLDEARRAIAALRAHPLEDLGLAEALRRRAAAVGERSGLAVTCSVNGDVDRLDPLVEQTVYRVADEALLNAERHAAARCVEVRLARSASQVLLTVHDDGQGFERAGTAAAEDGHFGLAGMCERAEAAGGRLEIESAPGQGTTVRLLLGLA